MRVLVIGGTEFISLHLVQALLRDRHEVVMLNRGRHPERTPKGARTIVCDRKDAAALKTALAGERFDGLVDITYAPTTGADVEALLAALGGRVGHAIFISTGRVHDHAQPMPLAEEAPRNLYWGEYARLKIEGEDAYMRSGVPATVVRPTLVYDAHAVYTTAKLRRELGLAPRYTLAAGLAQTFEWYRREGLDEREIDFSEEDALLAAH